MEAQDAYNIYKLYKEGFDDVMSRREEGVKSIEDFSDPNLFYRIIIGDSAFNDIVQSGVVRSITPQAEKVPINVSLAARPTAFPSFAKGSAAVYYAKENPNHYIVVSGSDLIKPLTRGKHGKGRTHFPTNAEGEYVNSLAGSEVSVYKHNGGGEYSLVYDKGTSVTRSAKER
jgi:hypothetical protein